MCKEEVETNDSIKMALPKQKYDRQLRIWGDHGQTALENANICLLNCGSTGSEALKNLVLGGIGSFTVVDSSRVLPSDLGNNYLVDFDSLGLSKAKCVSALLQELNESVDAKFVEESPETLIHSNPSFFCSFSLIIATQIPEQSLLELDIICRQNGIALLIGRSYGLTGVVRVSVEEHLVVESKQENPIDDLRLHKPWPQLEEFVSEFDLNVADPIIHKHIPFVVILIKTVQQWKQSHNGNLPKTSKERSDFKTAIETTKRDFDEENYREAIVSAFKVWAPPVISSELRSIFNDKETEVNASSADFWIVVSAMKEFVENEGEGNLPLNGSIPDMHSTTEFYVSLQKLYQAKAESDVSCVEKRVKSTLKRLGRDPQSISRATIKTFCKNCYHLKVLRYPSLKEEYSGKNGVELQRLLTVEDSSNAALYVLLRASDHFAAAYNRFPGVYEGESEEVDASRLKTMANALVTEATGGGGGAPSLTEDLITEICRFGAGELHVTGAVIGGILAQEAIKLLTHQFVPLAGTLVYNGMSSTSSVLKL